MNNKPVILDVAGIKATLKEYYSREGKAINRCIGYRGLFNDIIEGSYSTPAPQPWMGIDIEKNRDELNHSAITLQGASYIPKHIADDLLTAIEQAGPRYVVIRSAVDKDEQTLYAVLDTDKHHVLNVGLLTWNKLSKAQAEADRLNGVEANPHKRYYDQMHDGGWDIFDKNDTCIATVFAESGKDRILNALNADEVNDG